ncbi:MAG: phenylacetate--CoA ligase family protein [Deltaproteobacteria bacterium]|nr:phenylacetate--CoA ligase family protein [Deltaproteobacteria bacterium]
MVTGAYYAPDVETAPPDKIRDIQFGKLRRILGIVSKNNAFYKKKFQEQGLEIEDIRSIDDLSELPFTRKEEFQEDQERFPPFGSNLSEPLDNFIRYHQTTGTTGKPLKWLETRESWQWRRKVSAIALWAVGVRQSDIVFFPFSFGPHVAFWALFDGAQDIGALTIAGGGWSTLQRVKFIMDKNVTVVCCTPTYSQRLIEVAKEQGIDLRESALNTIVQAGEPGALIPGFRKKIKEQTGATPYDYTGLTEIGAYGFQCRHQEYAVHVNESEFILEVIDPKTGEEREEGELGEMVLTNLGRACSPSIRFRTRDLVRIKKGTCPCGRTFKMLDGGVLGRSDDMITIKGLNLFPSQIGELIQKHLSVGEEFQIMAYDKDGMGEVKVLVELGEGRNVREVEKVLKEELRQAFEMRMEVETVPRGTLARSDYKSKRFVDTRKVSK